MADVITPKFGGGNGNGGGGDTPTYAELLVTVESQTKVIMQQQLLLEEAVNKLAASKSANEMLKLTILDLMKTLQVNQNNINGTVRNLEQILKNLPKI